METHVYRLINTVNGKVYFGKTTDILGRWYNHCKDAEYGSPFPIHRAIRKYGSQAFQAEVLATYGTNKEACEHERRFIAEINPDLCYNITEGGGDGGHTMTPEQVEAQRAIKSEDYEEFRGLFRQGVPKKNMAQHFGVSYGSVGRCAERLGLSFQAREEARDASNRMASVERRREAKEKRELVRQEAERRRLEGSRRHRRKRAAPRPKMTASEYSAFRAEVARRANKARGAPPEAQAEALRLYFEEHLTAKEAALVLGISEGSVRGAVNRAYAKMSSKERSTLKHRHGSAVRSGNRNPNAERSVYKRGQHKE